MEEYSKFEKFIHNALLFTGGSLGGVGARYFILPIAHHFGFTSEEAVQWTGTVGAAILLGLIRRDVSQAVSASKVAKALDGLAGKALSEVQAGIRDAQRQESLARELAGLAARAFHDGSPGEARLRANAALQAAYAVQTAGMRTALGGLVGILAESSDGALAGAKAKGRQAAEEAQQGLQQIIRLLNQANRAADQAHLIATAAEQLKAGSGGTGAPSAPGQQPGIGQRPVPVNEYGSIDPYIDRLIKAQPGGPAGQVGAAGQGIAGPGVGRPLMSASLEHQQLPASWRFL